MIRFRKFNHKKTKRAEDLPGKIEPYQNLLREVEVKIQLFRDRNRGLVNMLYDSGNFLPKSAGRFCIVSLLHLVCEKQDVTNTKGKFELPL